MSLSQHDDHESKSRFTYRDFWNLRRSSSSCPLRVIALIDFDAFYAQCEIVRLGLSEDQPLCVVQFNHCIALNYAAKAAGLKRIISPEEARQKCPDVVLQHVATWREGDTKWAYRNDVEQHMKTDKAALDPYRLQSRKAFELIKSKLPAPPIQKVEKASIDEVFLDLSAQVYGLLCQRYPCFATKVDEVDADDYLPLPADEVLDWSTDVVVATTTDQEAEVLDWDDIALGIGAEIVRMIRQEVYASMRYTCSAGVAHNKPVAKLAAGHNKPDKQTIIRTRATAVFLAEYKFTKIRGLGGKLGHKIVEAFRTDETTALLEVPMSTMRLKLGSESGTWVYNVIRGIDYSEVVQRTQLQSMLAQKTFVPKAQGLAQAEKWLHIFAGDIMGRLEEQDATSQRRRPNVITLHHSINGRFGITRSKQRQIPPGAIINHEFLFDAFRSLLLQLEQEGPTWPCLVISGAVSDFEDGLTNNRSMTSFFSLKVQPRITDARKDDEVSIHQKRKRAEEDVDAYNRQNISSRQDDTMPDLHHFQNLEQGTTPCPSEVSSRVGKYRCPKCDNDISSADVLEHLDWHVAMELQGE